jgi:hypothetical protein
MSLNCSICHNEFEKDIHSINGVWVCEGCYPNGKIYNDEEVEYYPLHDVPDGCSTITWCPICNRQASVESIGSDWFYHDTLTGCGCTFIKIDLKTDFIIDEKKIPIVRKNDRRLDEFIEFCNTDESQGVTPPFMGGNPLITHTKLDILYILLVFTIIHFNCNILLLYGKCSPGGIFYKMDLRSMVLL